MALGIYNDARGGRGYGLFNIDKQKISKGIDTLAMYMAREGTHFGLANRGFGHTRFPSTGAVKYENSHPFKMGPIILAHNGIVHNHEELNKNYGRNFEVDSMHIAAHLAEDRSLEDVSAYGAIEWYDERDKCFRVCYFNGGSLEAVRIKDVGVLYSSSKDHLKEALDNCDLWSPPTTTPLILQYKKVYDITSGDFLIEGELDIGSYSSKRTWQQGGACGNHNYNEDNYSTSPTHHTARNKGGYNSHVTPPTLPGIAPPSPRDNDIKQWDHIFDQSRPLALHDVTAPPVKIIVPNDLGTNTEQQSMSECTDAEVIDLNPIVIDENDTQEINPLRVVDRQSIWDLFDPDEESGFYDQFMNPIAWHSIYDHNHLYNGDMKVITPDDAFQTWEATHSYDDIEAIRCAKKISEMREEGKKELLKTEEPTNTTQVII